MSRSRPLPGIRFEALTPPPGDALPRMDIPVFAGFAASGPVSVPVAVDDPAQFAMIFGGDVELPHARTERTPRFAHLGPTVRAFFRNGGQRCWIIRLAAARAPASFRIPNLFKVRDDGTAEPAFAAARSQGSWADGLRVAVNLVSKPLRFVRYRETQGDTPLPLIDVAVTSPRDVAPGDLVRLSWGTGSMELMVAVTTVRPVDRGVVQVSGGAFSVFVKPPAFKPFMSFSPPPFGTTIEVLTFDLTVRGDSERPQRMAGLGFVPDHQRAFGALPSDEALYVDPRPSDLAREVASPRFPLAAERALYIPMGMGVLPTEEVPATVAGDTALDRDGLANFSAELFLDAMLSDADVRSLFDRANALRFEAGHQLTGIHTALDVEEATMLAVPDAVHLGWEPDTPPAIVPPSIPEETPVSQECAPPCPTVFADCTVVPAIPSPALAASAPKNGTFELSWPKEEGAVDELQEATRFDYSDAATIFLGGGGSFDIFGRPAGVYYYRVRRHVGAELSAWSSIAVRVDEALGYVAADDAGDSAPILLEVQTAMIRLCAARGDMVALLSLPRHFEAAAAVAHAASLSDAFIGEPQALSYGAVWHPWLEGRGENAADLRIMPPDGATAGVMAARANARGAWVPPANEPLHGVVALTPVILESTLQELQDAAINIIRQTPAGFVCLDADTLSADDEIRPLNVRRLLILLRRAAVRTGNDYTFEPIGKSLRNTVRRGFESLLTNMFQRGAFAGQTARDAYRVITDDTVNTQNSIDNGRFIAELQVAPTRPLSFLTVRLLQRGGSSTAVEVR
jgi:hypothetical protein